MADLTDLQSALPVKVSGANPSTGVEDNFMEVDTNGAVKSTLRDPVTGTGVTTTTLGAKQALDVSMTGGGTDVVGSGTITALNGAVAVNTQGASALMLEISGTWVATLTFEGLVDSSSTWYPLAWAADVQTGLRTPTTTSNRVVAVYCGGFTQVRVRASLFTSGTVNVNYDASQGAQNYIANAMNNNGSAIPQQSVLVGGSDGTNIQPVAVDSLGRLITSSLTGFGAGFSFGDVSTSALTRVLVKRTAYTEQTTNSQRSFASASANDTSAGTGARTVVLTYLDQTGAGPFTETVTLNGTSRVNTVATNICYIERIKVATAGSGGVNAGIITLFTTPTSGGSAIWTIAAGDNQTFGAHHYVPTGKTCNITGVSCGHNGTTVGSGALFTIHSKFITVANSIENQISDFVRLYGQTSTFSRVYQSPIKITGPARLQMYVTPETSSSTIYRSAFDFFEP